MELNEAYAMLIKGLESTMNSNGFSVVVPADTEKGALPVTEKNGCTTLVYTGKKGTVKIEVFEGKISLHCAAREFKDAVDNDFASVSTSLFDPYTVDDKDIRYIVNDFSDGINDCYGKNQKAAKKLPKPVSKSAAKNGSVYYDLVTLGSRFTQIYPELKEEYKKNIDKYGEFLADDFFINYGNAKFRETVRENNPAHMKKLFNMLNEIYNDGTNQTQSVIVVTILGSLYDDEVLLANCTDYMEDMTLSVIETNKILKKSSSSRAKLAHPPLYKPKKQKKTSAFMNAMMGGTDNGQ